MILAYVQAEAANFVFTYRPPTAVKSVSVAGSFNDWNKDANPMKLAGDGKTYQLSLRLTPGKHVYKFVIDGEQWVLDPAAPSASDGNGNTNSYFILNPPDYGGPASPRDGRVAVSALAHLESLAYRNFDQGQLQLTLRARTGDLGGVSLRINGKSVRMVESPGDELYTTYRASIPWDRKRDVSYRFDLIDGQEKFEYGADGLKSVGKSQPFRIAAKGFQPFEVPSWVEKSVLYQIFPDRFENGDKTNDPVDVVPWDAKPQYWNHFGGDVAGVRKRISHLKDLGIDTVYFNPIFSSPSNHRYDATDYLKVDPSFGTNEEFGDLTKQLRASGIKTVLDGVFNHTATNFFAFNDVVKNGEGSMYRDWYTFRSFPVQIKDKPNYVAWFGFPSMPKLNLANPSTREYMLNIPKYWNDHADISGWRLDVANEVSSDYWRDFRKVVKAIGKDKWIVGEMWGDASRWLQGDQWDATMNYRFRSAVLSYVGKSGAGKPSDLMGQLMTTYHSYAPQVSRNLMNLISSHDTPRILTECAGDRDLAKLAATLQFTWVGAPSIYYGDELGMAGQQDPDNRRGMQWQLASPSNDIWLHYKKLIAIRHRSSALQSGEPKPIFTDDKEGTLAFARILGRQVAVVAVNRSSEPKTVSIPVKPLGAQSTVFTDALLDRIYPTSKEGNLIVSLAPKGAAVLIPRYRDALERSAR